MSVDVKGTLEGYLVNNGTGINIPSTIGNAFGSAIGAAVENLFTGSIQLNGATFALTGDSATAKITGTGSAAPVLSEWDVTATFTATQNAVQLGLMAGFQSSWAVSNAWSVLNTYPFSSLTLSNGQVALNVNPGDQAFNMSLNATASLDASPIGTGLLVASYASQKLGFLGGFIVTGTWSPSSKWPVVGTLSIQGETGVFASTITVTDLSAFKSLNLPYLPSSIDPGLTFLADIELSGGTLAPIADFFPAGTNLSLIANLPPGGISAGASVVATLTEPASNNAFNFQNFSLAWKSSSATSGTIEISITAVFNASSTDVLNLTGDGTFTYGAQPSLSVDATISGSGGWTHPFGIQNLTILSVSIGFSIGDEGFNVGVDGVIQIGTGQQEPVNLEVATAILDFEAPSFIKAELSSADQGKSVTLAQLITDFIPSLNLNDFPLLNDISFKELMFLAVAAPIELDGKNYSPGIGATGDISFFGYDLDFAFSLITQPSIAVQAKGSISQGGGPIVISAGGVQILKLSDTTGTLGPSACIDTKGAGFCGSGSVTNAYFTINAAMELLGLINSSVAVQASSDSFEFDVSLDVASIFTEQMHCEFIPDKGDFAASLNTAFNPPDITLGPWGPIPQFTIPTPKASLCVAFGTLVPSSPVCGALPTSAPYFSLDVTFSWGPIDFSLSIDLQMSDVINAFNDFASFVKNLLLNSAKAVLDAFLASAEALVKLLYQIGWALAEIAEKIASYFVMGIEAAWQLASNVIDALLQVCGVESGNSALQPGVSTAMVRRQPQFLGDFTASPKGQELLYHYYLHREEVEPLLKSMRRGHPQAALLAAHVAASDYETGKHVPIAIDLLSFIAENGSAGLQASVAEVTPKLEQYRDMTYNEMLAALNA